MSPHLFFPKSHMLEKAQSDHGQDGVVAQSCPVPALQMIEAEFLLHLLVALLADPARLDIGGQRRVLGVVGQVIPALVRGPLLTDQPGGRARQTPAGAQP